MSKKLQNIWYKEMSERLNIRNIASIALYGSESLIPPENFLSREKKTEKELKQSLKSMKCKDKKVLKAIEEYRTIVKKSYFEIGVIIGACLAAEILLKEDGV